MSALKRIVGTFLVLAAALVPWTASHAAYPEKPIKSHVETHPFPVFGDLNAYDWTIYVPLHTIRHTKQMIEVMETDGYPAD